MTRKLTRFVASTSGGIAAAVFVAAAAIPQARATGFDLGTATDFAVLYEGHNGNSLQFNNSTVTGNIGIDLTGKFAGSSGTINGNIEFAAANTSQFSNTGFTLNGTVSYSQSLVSSSLAPLNSLSQTLGQESGTSTIISSGGLINASSGTLDANGNRVFTVTSISFPNGNFTINGTSADYVVLNVAGSVGNNGLNGSIVLSGGITADHVLINYTPSTSNLTAYNSAYTNLTGGPTLTISTNGATTTADFLDPTGNIQINHSILDGRLFGGDTQNFSLVSGAEINAPVVGVPGPIVGAGLPGAILAFGGLLSWMRRRKPALAA